MQHVEPSSGCVRPFFGHLSDFQENSINDLFLSVHGRKIPPCSPESAKGVFSSFLESQLTPATPLSDFSYFSSLFLLRKSLPPKKPDIQAYLNKLSAEPYEDQKFISTIKTYVPMMFPRGWDKDYLLYAQKCVPTVSSSFERSRHKGGARSAALEEGYSYDSFLKLLLEGSEIDPTRKVRLVERDGKVRLVTVASFMQSQLLPLHLMIYDRLSQTNWLLRGDANKGALAEFKVQKDEVFVSGDYESATDNFSSAHSHELLKAILFHAHNVPIGIKQAALGSLTGFLLWENSISGQVTGQLMGNFLSFPLLCLTNFLTVVHSLGWKRANTIPLKINGDDIVFRATRGEAELWCAGVKSSGLSLSIGKTLIHWRFFSINSTFFCARQIVPRVVPVIRSSCITRDCSSPDALASRAKALSWGWCGKKRRVIESFVIKWHHKVARKGHVSWSRGRRTHLGVVELAQLNLLKREISALETNEELDCDFGSHAVDPLPRCFVRVKSVDVCKPCRVVSSHCLSVHQALEAWERKHIPEKEQQEKGVVIEVVRQRYRHCRLAGSSPFRWKKFLWNNRPGMKLLWDRPWLRRKEKIKESWVYKPALCCRCVWLCEKGIRRGVVRP